MTTLRKPFKKTALAIAAMLVVGVAPMEQAVGASCTWNPLAGNWNNPAAWSCGVVPGSADSATIGAGKVVTVNTGQSIFGLTNIGSINIDAFLLTLQGGGGTTNTGTINVGSGVTAALQVQGGHNITNTGGVINIANGSVMNQFGSTITGGTINTAGTGALVAFNNNANFLDGVAFNGTLNMAVGSQVRERIVNGLSLAGTVNLNSSALLAFEGTQTLAGTGSIVFGDGNGGAAVLGVDGVNPTLTIGAGITVRGQNGIIGDQAIVGGGGNGLVNNGRIASDGGGTITIRNLAAGLVNNGILQAQTGTLTIVGNGGGVAGTGTLQVDSTGVMNLSNVANTQGKLIMGAAGSVLNIGTQNLTITNDYTNIGAGSGNGFDRRAGVNGAGLIVAGGNAAQAITGTGVTNGNTANATLTLDNVRVGATTFNYQVANTGNTGPSLCGAIQTSVNGANLNDARLSGAGVTASNYNTGAPGSNSGDLGVTFTAANAGALAPLAGQVLNLRSNFSNIADQKLNIVLAGGAAAYNAAVGNAASPVQVANQRTGGSNTAVVTVANGAPAGSFSEDLNVSVASVSGAATATASSGGWPARTTPASAPSRSA